MTRPLALCALLACAAPPREPVQVPQRATPAKVDGARGNAPSRMEAAGSAGSGKPTPAGMAGSSLPEAGALLSQLDAIDARVKALAERDPDPALCDSACLAGVQSVQLRRGLVSCRCRAVPRLAVYRMPEARR